MKQSIQRKRILSRLKILLLVAFLYYLVTWFTGCPFRFLFGISCPGCGMTRAWLYVLHLDFAAAFQSHPLFWMAPLFLFWILFEDSLDRRRLQPWIYGCAALFLIVYFLRLIWFPDPIVKWEPQEGLLWSKEYIMRHIVRPG